MGGNAELMNPGSPLDNDPGHPSVAMVGHTNLNEYTTLGDSSVQGSSDNEQNIRCGAWAMACLLMACSIQQMKLS
jgi:hypothetical protein